MLRQSNVTVTLPSIVVQNGQLLAFHSLDKIVVNRTKVRPVPARTLQSNGLFFVRVTEDESNMTITIDRFIYKDCLYEVRNVDILLNCVPVEKKTPTGAILNVNYNFGKGTDV